MHVALERENSRAVAELIRHPVYLAAGRMAARGICPKGAYHIVLLPTAWGYCGAVWKNVGGGRAGERSDFPASCEAKLSRIMTPGLPVSEMRRQLLAEHEGSQEVLCDPHGKFHPGVAPEWLGELKASTEKVARKLSPETSSQLQTPKISPDEKGFRWMLNENAMATEKLSEGIRVFAADAAKLEALIRR